MIYPLSLKAPLKVGRFPLWGKGVMSLGSKVRALFTNGEQGIWLDPSDMSTMFQDSAGTIPVTADGQPVGLILDKSKGLVLGPELVPASAMQSTVGWSPVNCTIAIVGNELELTATATGVTYCDYILANDARISSKFSASARNGQASGQAYCALASAYSLYITLSGGTSLVTATGIKQGLSFAGNEILRFRFDAASIGSKAYFSLPSVKALPGNHASQATAAARPLYKTDGTYGWLQFDGVDDSLSTAAINFTATDKMSVFAGARKNTNTLGMMFELTTNSNTGAGPFYLSAGSDIVTGWNSLSRGDTPINSNHAATYAMSGADTSVIASTHDIAGDLSTIRRNTVAGTTATGDKGAGNFANAPLYIGARNASTIYFNGNIYSLIVRGALSTTQEINDTEAWVNSKTGAY